MNHALYRYLWRWHFYAGLFVLPFLLILALTGIVMLLNPQLEKVQFGDWLQVSVTGTPHSAAAQLNTVQQHFPAALIEQYRPAREPSDSSRFHISLNNNRQMVFVDPYQNAVLGSIAVSDTWYAIADDIHGTLLLGSVGDGLLEAAAGLCIFLLLSGLYLHWPRSAGQSWWKIPARTGGKRFAWRQLHGALGVWLSVALVFFALSGLAWTGIWGQKIVQPWGSFPAERSARFWQQNDQPASQSGHHPAPVTARITATLNTANLNGVPWGLEQTPLPHAHPVSDHHAPLSLNDVMQQGVDLQMHYFRVSLPRSEGGVFTLLAATMSGDISNPLHDRTVHIHPHTGEVLADIGWHDYNLLAKAMAAGIALHKGLAGPVNLVLNLLLCALLMLLAVAGGVLWWKRRSVNRPNLQRPPSVGDGAIHYGALALILLCAVVFPLSGAALIMFALLDTLLNRLRPAPSLDIEEENLDI